MALTFSRRSTEQSLVFGTANESTMPDQRPTLVRRRSTSQSLQSHGRAGPQIRPATSTSMRLATRNANVALQCWTLPASEGGAGGTQANLLERAISSVSLTAGVAEEGEDGDFLRRVLKSGRLSGLHKACAQGNINAVVSIVKIDSERHGQLGYAGLSGCDVFGRTPLMYAAVADSKPCLDMLLTCGAKREVRDPSGHTAVHYAAYFGKHRALKFLIEAACDWTPKDIYGRTPLHTSICSDSVKCLQILLKHKSTVGGNVDETDMENMTALHVAAHSGKSQHLALLLKAGANPTAVDIEGKTSMHWTVTNTDSSCVNALHTASPAIVNLRDIYNENVLHAASKLGYAHIVDAVCSLVNCDMDAKCRDDQSALHLATIHCQVSAVAALLRHNALDACVDSFGLSPLHYAVQAGNTDIIRHFCQLSSIANLPDSDGRRPLHWAVVEDNPEILTMLLGHGDMLKHIDVEDKFGMTAAHIAIEAGSTGCLTELLVGGANMTRRTHELECPLYFACETGKAGCVDLITKAGFNANTVSSEGQSCLHAAILGKHSAAIKALLVHSADPNTYDADGVSALQAAAFHGVGAAVTTLLLYGARVDEHGSSGLTPLHLASANGFTEVVEALLQEGASVNISEISELRHTAVDIAVENGRQACIDILREHGGLGIEEIRELAATCIQASIRGFLARKNTAWVVTRKNAVILIQRTVRGFLQRQRYQLMLKREHAAVLVQSQWRGYAERCRFHARLSELYNQEYHQRVTRSVYHGLLRQWALQGLRRTPPKAKPPVLTRKQRERNPPPPPIPPAYDLEPVKSVTDMLAKETADEREERMARERRQRLEMALAMRNRHAKEAKTKLQFQEQEKKRREQKEIDKERERYSSIVQASMKRHDRGRALLQHAHTVRSTVTAAIAVQRCFRMWRDKTHRGPLLEQEKRREMERQNNAAETIQQTWRHYRGMKKVKDARQLLNEYRIGTLLRGTEAEMEVARYQRPTMRTRCQSRKLLVTPSSFEATSRQETGVSPPSRPASRPAPPLQHQQAARAELQHAIPNDQGYRAKTKRSMSMPRAIPSELINASSIRKGQVSAQLPHDGSKSSMSGHKPIGRATSQVSKRLIPASDVVGDMTKTALQEMSRPQRTKSTSTLPKPPGSITGKVAVPMSAVNAKRWSISALPVLPEINKK